MNLVIVLNEYIINFLLYIFIASVKLDRSIFVLRKNNKVQNYLYMLALNIIYFITIFQKNIYGYEQSMPSLFLIIITSMLMDVVVTVELIVFSQCITVLFYGFHIDVLFVFVLQLSFIYLYYLAKKYYKKIINIYVLNMFITTIFCISQYIIIEILYLKEGFFYLPDIQIVIFDIVFIGLFMITTKIILKYKDKNSYVEAERILTIATHTQPYLRKGLNMYSAKQTVKIIYEALDYEAIAITDCEKILAYIGMDGEENLTGTLIQDENVKKAIKESKYIVIKNKKSIDSNISIVIPLKQGERVIGTMILYKQYEEIINVYEIKIANGLGNLFSVQIELSEIEYQRILLNKAERRALQAQIKPHFLFNAINTIMSFCRIDADKARQLLLNLSMYLRNSFKNTDEFVTIYKELEHIQAYLYIERARFSKRLKVIYEIEQNLNCILPPLILQPIVENSVIHGLLTKEEGGTIKITANKSDCEYIIEIEDDGIGMGKEQVSQLLNDKNKKTGVGIKNVNNRLKSIYGRGLIIESELGKGTKIKIIIPKERAENND